MKEENCLYIPTDMYYKSVWEIKCNIARGTLKRDESDFNNSELYLELAMSGLPLPCVYAKEDRFGNMEIIKGSNIINGLLEYIENKKNVERYRARIENVGITIFKIRYCKENNSRFDYIEEMIKKI